METPVAELVLPSPSAAKSDMFVIKVLYTQHTSAQGTVQWVDEGKVVCFRSFMELVHLLEEAIQQHDDAHQFRSWQHNQQEQEDENC